MRYNRWVRKGAKRDIERICTNHPEMAVLIRPLADWMIAQLAENPKERGELLNSQNVTIQFRRWTVGPLTVIFRMMPDEDQTVIIVGFVPGL